MSHFLSKYHSINLGGKILQTDTVRHLGIYQYLNMVLTQKDIVIKCGKVMKRTGLKVEKRGNLGCRSNFPDFSRRSDPDFSRSSDPYSFKGRIRIFSKVGSGSRSTPPGSATLILTIYRPQSSVVQITFPLFIILSY